MIVIKFQFYLIFFFKEQDISHEVYKSKQGIILNKHQSHSRLKSAKKTRMEGNYLKSTRIGLMTQKKKADDPHPSKDTTKFPRFSLYLNYTAALIGAIYTTSSMKYIYFYHENITFLRNRQLKHLLQP